MMMDFTVMKSLYISSQNQYIVYCRRDAAKNEFRFDWYGGTSAAKRTWWATFSAPSTPSKPAPGHMLAEHPLEEVLRTVLCELIQPGC
jgi:hypothetical protein